MTDQVAPEKNPWYKKWWVWVIIGIVGLGVIAALAPASEDAETATSETTTTIVSESTTTEPAPTTTEPAPTTTEPEATTTTVAPTTTTTLPPVIAEGTGSGDDVTELELPDIPVVVDLTHSGSGNIAVWSLDTDFESVDLLVNEIGSYTGTRPMQWNQDEVITGLEITASGDWTYEIRPLLQEDQVACPVNGQGDSVILIDDFASNGGTADLVHEGDGNFAIWAWGSDGVDLLVNEIGAYEGTVRVPSGLFIWDISANGGWTVDC